MSAAAVAWTSVHATCILCGETGILIRGGSGAGKSKLGRDLIRAGERGGGFARLVADDRVRLRAASGRLIARPVPPLEGVIEIRGFGLASAPHAPACVVGLVVDLVAGEAERMPDPDALVVEVLGVRLARIATPLDLAVDMVAWRLRGRDDTIVTEL